MFSQQKSTKLKIEGSEEKVFPTTVNDKRKKSAFFIFRK